MDWILQNWAIVALVVLVLDKIVAVTPTKWDDIIVTSVKEVLAKASGKKFAILFVAFGLVAQIAVLCPGCAVKTIADLDPRDQALATVDMLIDQYVDMYQAYTDAMPSLSEDQQAWCRSRVAPAMNIAKRAIKLASDAAIAWKLADGDAQTQSEAYSAALAEARTALGDAIDLYQYVTGGAS